ncbi:ECF transporter S component [[Clostridium] fimetarium]|uniref:Energy-coupling factor transport system substrate-specific component n=1 Tax=[Clostridium] fimetarium TaxID=99656 RepID=A0A1I0QSL0_9FIRM|nr:ECF transporter S component [[Clostridium] fimetarium]SEW30224.1 energy-coupling factor transport system substrate-specific component [[Clostridium] fimetarium]
MRRNHDVSQYILAAKKRTVFALILIVVIIPITLFLGFYFNKNDSYMLLSAVLILYTLLPFVLVFEHRKPKAREIVMLSSMSALTVCANLLCAFTVPVHAGTALVIISGIALGPEAGFLVGALSRFVCNFFTGQGPWTPWEMIAWGIIGFLAGVTFNKVDLDKVKSRDIKVIMGPIISIIATLIFAYVIFLFTGKQGETFFGWRLYAYGMAGLVIGMLLQRHRLPVDSVTVPIYTLFSVFIIYGGIMNIAALIMTNSVSPGDMQINFESLKLLYITGAPYDAMHAVGASVCVFLFGDSVIRKIERVKIKYGIYK